MQDDAATGASVVADPSLNCTREMDPIPKKKRRTMKDDLPYTVDSDRDACNDADARDDAAVSMQPTTSAELSKREMDVLRRERELRRKSDKLEKQLLDVARAEEALGERSAEVVLAQLEEHFICPL